MSLELEVLDQLLGGTMPATTLRKLFLDDATFSTAIHGLLLGGDLILLDQHTQPIAQWRWRELFNPSGLLDGPHTLHLSITQQGIARIT